MCFDLRPIFLRHLSIPSTYDFYLLIDQPHLNTNYSRVFERKYISTREKTTVALATKKQRFSQQKKYIYSYIILPFVMSCFSSQSYITCLYNSKFFVLTFYVYMHMQPYKLCKVYSGIDFFFFYCTLKKPEGRKVCGF